MPPPTVARPRPSTVIAAGALLAASCSASLDRCAYRCVTEGSECQDLLNLVQRAARVHQERRVLMAKVVNAQVRQGALLRSRAPPFAIVV
jgi:hypothetical protein